jgi:prepilin-type N-terminal cleavage/methylation domain-containing protein
MITTTPKPSSERPRSPRRGFSLVEILVASSLATIVMAGVMTAFLFIGRTSISLRNYADLETQARNALETFAQDVRMSSGVTWNSSTSLALTIQQGNTTIPATYAYDPAARTFSRTVGTTTEVLITNIRNFSFNAYGIDTTSISLSTPTANTNNATKQIQISLETERINRTLALHTNKVISARFVLRNKRVSA